MIHIAYKIDKSALHGVGLFAAQDIEEGQLIYSASPALDIELNANQFDALHDLEKKEVRHWGYWIEEKQVWHVDFDMSKFINHNLYGTVTQDPDRIDAWLTATRYIKAGEELTQNYLEFESEDDLKARGIL